MGAAMGMATTYAAALAAGPSAARAASPSEDDGDWLGEPPAVTVDDCKETVEAEVVVVGGALAGEFAAYAAILSGADVVMLERNGTGHVGGSGIGFINSRFQLDAGQPEQVREHEHDGSQDDAEPRHAQERGAPHLAGGLQQEVGEHGEPRERQREALVAQRAHGDVDDLRVVAHERDDGHGGEVHDRAERGDDGDGYEHRVAEGALHAGDVMGAVVVAAQRLEPLADADLNAVAEAHDALDDGDGRDGGVAERLGQVV